MPTVPVLTEAQLEQVSRLLGDCATGTDISRVLTSLGIEDISGESTKWRRLYAIFFHHQKQDRAASKLIDFIRTLVDPSRYTSDPDKFEITRQGLNTILAFSGLQYGNDGQFRQINPAATLDEAHERTRTLQAKFRGRRIHPEVLKYCKPELLQDNYFHAVFEATKGLAQRIRDQSGITLDGAALVDKVFAVDRPILVINSLQTETERTEHKGFASLLKGCFAAVRNPLAHEPKLLWKGEDDAADYLSLVSLLHRKLDEAVSTSLGGNHDPVRLPQSRIQRGLFQGAAGRAAGAVRSARKLF